MLMASAITLHIMHGWYQFPYCISFFFVDIISFLMRLIYNILVTKPTLVGIN
jgi:hypothetical protein